MAPLQENVAGPALSASPVQAFIHPPSSEVLQPAMSPSNSFSSSNGDTDVDSLAHKLGDVSLGSSGSSLGTGFWQGGTVYYNLVHPQAPQMVQYIYAAPSVSPPSSTDDNFEFYEKGVVKTPPLMPGQTGPMYCQDAVEPAMYMHMVPPPLSQGVQCTTCSPCLPAMTYMSPPQLQRSQLPQPPLPPQAPVNMQQVQQQQQQHYCEQCSAPPPAPVPAPPQVPLSPSDFQQQLPSPPVSYNCVTSTDIERSAAYQQHMNLISVHHQQQQQQQQTICYNMPEPTESLPSPMERETSISQTLQRVWYPVFSEQFRTHLPGNWEISPSVTVPPVVPNSENLPPMKTHMDSAKVRFICPKCDHHWTSMKGRVLFGYDHDASTDQGLVVFKLFGQKCEKCQRPEWVHAMWYEEEIKKVIYNVCQKVGVSFFKWPKPRVRIDRRAGRPSKPHNALSCQACEEGICKEEKNFASIH